MKLKSISAISLLFSLLGGCTSSSLVHVRHETSSYYPPFTNMLVIGVSRNAAKRHLWEDAFIDELKASGVTATPSYGLFPDSPPDTTQVIAVVQPNGFDGILVIRRLPSETRVKYIEETSVSRESIHYFAYWPRYWAYYHDLELPGLVDTVTTDLRSFDVTATANGGQLIWSATSRTPDPASARDVQQSISHLVIAELSKEKIIRSIK